MSDLNFQLKFVAENAWRLSGMQDSNPISPSFGCFHLAFWRDKVSEFPDARFQEAGATLGLLSLSSFDSFRQSEVLSSSENLYEGFRSGLIALTNQQYRCGSFDEWYKGERGYAATEFPMIAYGLATYLMKDRIKQEDFLLLNNFFLSAGKFLSSRQDKVKSNHEAAAATALALAFFVTKEKSFEIAARNKIKETLTRQTSEGWFPEVSGMDIGYCFVLLDYVMLYIFVTGDEEPIPAMRKLFDFIFPFIHPDLTVSPEIGLCLNPYVGRLGTSLLSRFDEKAAVVTAEFSRQAVGHKGLIPYLGDDLRFTRWSHLPVVTHLLHKEFEPMKDSGGLGDKLPKKWTFRKEAGVCAYHQDKTHLYFFPSGGGGVRYFYGEDLVLEDLGYFLKSSKGNFSCSGYNLKRPLEKLSNGFKIQVNFGRSEFFYPSFLSRLILRIGCIIPKFSQILRSLIDWYRMNNKTAINQSAAPVSDAESSYLYTRKVTIDGLIIIIHDTLEGMAEKSLITSSILKVQDSGLPILKKFEAQKNKIEIIKKIELFSINQLNIYKSQEITEDRHLFKVRIELPRNYKKDPKE
jgi:hypothetical protein